MESFIAIFILGPELPFITFGSKLPHSHLSTPYLFFLLSLFTPPPPCWREGHGKVHVPPAFMTCHKTVDCGHVQSPTSFLVRVSHVVALTLSLLTLWVPSVWNVRSWSEGGDEGRTAKGDRIIYLHSSPVSGFQSSALLSPSPFWHSPGSLGVISGVESLLCHRLSVSFPFPHASYAENCLKGNRVVGSYKYLNLKLMKNSTNSCCYINLS